MKKIQTLMALLLTLALLLPASALAEEPAAPDYDDGLCWAYRESEASDKPVDVFFVTPTVYGGKEGSYSMPLDSVKNRVKFLSAADMEKGIYDDSARFFAPYYRQYGMTVGQLSREERERLENLAFSDLKAAFETYMAEDNGGRPIIVAGFSQGAQHAIRLVKECFETPERQAQLVACYAVGWPITQEELDTYPWLRRAEREDDVGVVISFDCEAENITGSVIVPEGVRSLSINPPELENGRHVRREGAEPGGLLPGYRREHRRGDPSLYRRVYRRCARHPEGDGRRHGGIPGESLLPGGRHVPHL